MALLAKTAEARSQGEPPLLPLVLYILLVLPPVRPAFSDNIWVVSGDMLLSYPRNGNIAEQSRSTLLASKWSSRNRYASKLDTDTQLDPIDMGMLSLETAEKLFDLLVLF